MTIVWPGKIRLGLVMLLAEAMSQMPRLKRAAMMVRVSPGETVVVWVRLSRAMVPLQTGGVSKG